MIDSFPLSMTYHPEKIIDKRIKVVLVKDIIYILL